MAVLQRQYQAMPEPTTDPASLLKTLKASVANIEVLCGMRKAVPGIADQLTDLRADAEGSHARFTEYVQVSTANGEALARRTSTLEAGLNDANAKIELVDEARVTGDEALAQRASALETDMNGNTGRVSTIDKAHSDAESALGQRIDQVSAQAGAGFANGSLAFAANAGPDGYAASFDLSLTAGYTGGAVVKSGISVLAKKAADGSFTSSIMLTASQFTLYDPTIGNANPVFNYASGIFTFNVPVVIRSQDIARRATTLPVFSRNGNNSGSVRASVVITTVDTDTIVDITCDFDGQPTTSYPFGLAVQYLTLTRTDGDGSSNPTQIQAKLLSFFTSGNSDNRSVGFLYTAILAQDAPGRIGSFVYTVGTTTGQGPVTIKALASYK